MYTVQVFKIRRSTGERVFTKPIPFAYWRDATSYACPFVKSNGNSHFRYEVILRKNGKAISYYSNG